MKKHNIITRLLTAVFMLFALAYQGLCQTFAPREECHNSFARSPHPTGNISLLFEFAPTSTNLLVKGGAIPGKVALCGATDEPMGVGTDTPASGELGNVAHLGAVAGTVTMTAGAAIAAQARVFTAASGKVSSTGGTGKYLVGRAVAAAAADGDPVEVVPCFPVVQA